jgi:hypothetical protein
MIEKTKIIQNNIEVIKDIPNLKLVVVGWLGICFSILHFFPKIITELIEKLFKFFLPK